MSWSQDDLNEADELRFVECIAIQQPNECWKWLGPKTGQGYPTFNYQHKTVSAVRMLWQFMAEREVLTDQILVHTCGVSDCMNPGHLELTTRSALMQ